VAKQKNIHTKHLIYAVVCKKRFITIEGIRKEIIKDTGRIISWNTIRAYSNELIDEGKINEEIISNKGRKVSIIINN
jgi:hypothetical protein